MQTVGIGGKSHEWGEGKGKKREMGVPVLGQWSARHPLLYLTYLQGGIRLGGLAGHSIPVSFTHPHTCTKLTTDWRGRNEEYVCKKRRHRHTKTQTETRGDISPMSVLPWVPPCGNAHKLDGYLNIMCSMWTFYINIKIFIFIVNFCWNCHVNYAQWKWSSWL